MSSVSYASSVLDGVHFGLGASAAPRKVTIIWPRGKRQVLENVSADQRLRVTEPVAEPRR